MSRISIEVTPEQHKSIKALALMEGVPMKELIWEMCDARLKEHRAAVKKDANYGAGHDDCPICHAMGPNRRYNAKTEQRLNKARKEKNTKIYRNADEMFRDLGLR